MTQQNRMVLTSVVKKEIEQMQEEHAIGDKRYLVNTNRIYDTIAFMMRKTDYTSEIVSAIDAQKMALGRMQNGREMYVPMSINEIKIGFEGRLATLPDNTFREYDSV